MDLLVKSVRLLCFAVLILDPCCLLFGVSVTGLGQGSGFIIIEGHPSSSALRDRYHLDRKCNMGWVVFRLKSNDRASGPNSLVHGERLTSDDLRKLSWDQGHEPSMGLALGVGIVPHGIELSKNGEVSINRGAIRRMYDRLNRPDQLPMVPIDLVLNLQNLGNLGSISDHHKLNEIRHVRGLVFWGPRVVERRHAKLSEVPMTFVFYDLKKSSYGNIPGEFLFGTSQPRRKIKQRDIASSGRVSQTLQSNVSDGEAPPYKKRLPLDSVQTKRTAVKQECRFPSINRGHDGRGYNNDNACRGGSPNCRRRKEHTYYCCNDLTF